VQETACRVHFVARLLSNRHQAPVLELANDRGESHEVVTALTANRTRF